MMNIVLKYFPELSAKQREKIALLGPLYNDWNQKINLISRKDIDAFYEKHVLHSLAIAKIIRFTKGTTILDAGTGGGFPGIPLAILFPETHFHLVDSIGKKINAVKAITGELKLENVSAEQIRVEQLKGKYDFVVSRAVTRLPEFVKWTGKNISPVQRNALPNGILYLKGGNVNDEIKPFKNMIFIYNISDYFNESFFETKKLLFLVI